MLDPESLQSPEEAVEAIGSLLEGERYEEAQELIEPLEGRFPDSAVVHHALGLVLERTYLEHAAAGENPDLRLYQDAERHYRRAVEIEPEGTHHLERLYATVFVLGSRQGDLEKLREAYDLALKLTELSEEISVREAYAREAAIVATAIARATGDLQDWKRADRLFLETKPPLSDREGYFYHFYQGLVSHELGTQADDQDQLRRAVLNLRLAEAEQPGNRGVSWLLADSLVQLREWESAQDLRDAERLVQGLVASSPEDPLVQSLQRRFQLRQEGRQEPPPAEGSAE